MSKKSKTRKANTKPSAPKPEKSAVKPPFGFGDLRGLSLTAASFRSAPWAGEPDPTEIDDEKRRILNTWPSPLELAHLASSIAAAGITVKRDDKTLAERALELWNACQDELNYRARVFAKLTVRHRVGEEMKARIPMPKHFPAKLDDALLRLGAGRSKDDRLQTLKGFIRASIETGRFVFGAPEATTPEQIAEKVEDFMQGLSQNGIADAEFFLRISKDFKTWKTERGERVYSERSSKGGRAAASKRKTADAKKV